MTKSLKTKYENQIKILAEVWLRHRTDDQFEEFIEYANLGLPIAFAMSINSVEKDGLAKPLVKETFDALLNHLDLDDMDFENLAEMLA